jgi:N-carbamoyl-L-amino-acid hydrolase
MQNHDLTSLKPKPFIDSERLWRRVEALSHFTDPNLPWTRRAFGDQYLKAREWLCEQMEQAGLTIRQDEGGNLIGRREGRVYGLAPLITGSHSDTVMEGGRFDGIIGVLAGIEVAHILHEQECVLAHPLEVIDFLSEEPSDYGISCVGSRAFAGVLDSSMLTARRSDGQTLAEGLRAMGVRPEALNRPLRAAGSTAAFVELHIEQGQVLEKHNLPIGVVTNIVGIRRVAITVVGRTDHAGTTPMDLRNDALVGAAHLIEAVNIQARTLGNGRYVVATIGRLNMTPNMPNAVPGKVNMILEIRSDDESVLAAFPEKLLADNADHLANLGVKASFEPFSNAKGIACSPIVMQAIEEAADTLGYAHIRLPSGAGHDSVYVSRTGPVGMIFVPCRQGRSHCPDEWIEPEQLENGAKVLYRTLLVLDGRLS